MVRMPGPRRSRSTVVVILLVAALGMAAVLAYEAQQAARSHRATAENVLRDYAAFAAFELSRVGRAELLNVVLQELDEVRRAVRRGGLEAAIGASSPGGSGCGCAYKIRTAFTASLPDALFEFAGEAPSDQIRNILTTAALDGMRNPKDFTCPAMRVVSVNGEHLALIWRPVHDSKDVPVGIVGFTSDTSFVGNVIRRVLKQSPLLPPSLMQTANASNAALLVRVATPEGAPLFSSAQEWSDYSASQQLQKDLGDLKLSVALQKDVAARLIIGGLPRERLPLILGLLTLTAGVMFVAFVQLRREAELSRLRSDFVSGVSHELRTPLAQIRMFAETLLLGRVRSELEARRSLEIIGRETQRLEQLVENVLLFARGERRPQHLLREPTRLSPLITDIVESFAPVAAARQSRVTTTCDYSIVADVDPGAIRQIMLNLLDNAVKYGPAGQTVSVIVRLDEDRVQLVVEDQGPGIDSRDAERIWHPFDRLSRSASVTGGTGIGLAIVRQLTALHGGRAWVEPGRQGARFVIEISGAWIEPGAATGVA
jgi:signal transduction histidine kinase